MPRAALVPCPLTARVDEAVRRRRPGGGALLPGPVAALLVTAPHVAALVITAPVGGGGCSPPAPVVDDDVVPSMHASAAQVRSWPVVDGWRLSPVLPAPAGASRVAFLAHGAPGVAVALEAAAVGHGDDVGHGDGALQFMPASVTWRDTLGRNDRFVARVDLGAGATAVRVRVRDDHVAALRSLTWEAVVPAPAAPADDGLVPARPVVRQAVHRSRQAFAVPGGGGGVEEVRDLCERGPGRSLRRGGPGRARRRPRPLAAVRLRHRRPGAAPCLTAGERR